jgi:hypothetical protein
MPQLRERPNQASLHQTSARQQPSKNPSLLLRLVGWPVGALMAATVAAAPLHAGTTGFSGDYDPSNWTTTLSTGSDGSVDTTNAPNDITITGPNNLQASSSITYTTNATSFGLVNFEWLYTTTDTTPGQDSFGYLLNGAKTLLTDDQTSSPSGTTSFSVVSGDNFGFYVDSTDGDFGAAIATIYNFSGPGSPATSVPAPAAVLGALAAFDWSRKLRRRRTLLGNEQRHKSQA